MANISNGFAAVASFFFGGVMLWFMNTAVTYMIGDMGDTTTVIIAYVAYLLFIGFLMVWFPIHLLTSEDNNASQGV